MVRDKMLEVKFYVNENPFIYELNVNRKGQTEHISRSVKRDTYEIPGGHREAGEGILEAAERELKEETGAVEFTIAPVCVYSVTGKTRVNETGEETYGLLCFAEIAEFCDTLENEIEKVVLLGEMPTDWTYPQIQPKLIEEYMRRDRERAR